MMHANIECFNHIESPVNSSIFFPSSQDQSLDYLPLSRCIGFRALYKAYANHAASDRTRCSYMHPTPPFLRNAQADLKRKHDFSGNRAGDEVVGTTVIGSVTSWLPDTFLDSMKKQSQKNMCGNDGDKIFSKHETTEITTIDWGLHVWKIHGSGPFEHKSFLFQWLIYEILEWTSLCYWN